MCVPARGILGLLLVAVQSMGAGLPCTLKSSSDIVDATRGAGRFARLPPSTTFLIANGTYRAPGGIDTLLWIKKGGTQKSARHFVGESRDGVIIAGRATVFADHVVISNMTFDLSDYSDKSNNSYGTITIVNAGHVRISGVTCTGAGRAGKRGGHIETDCNPGQKIPHDILIENCIIEKFGRYDEKDGRLDHGIYLDAGRHVTIRNNLIRQNAGRGIQLYAHAGGEGMIEDITIADNRICENGRFAYTDGIVVAVDPGAPTGSIRRVVIRNNVIARNAFSGLRFTCDASEAIVVENNTFFHNGTDYDRGAEMFFDDGGGAHNIEFRGNALKPVRVALRGWRHAVKVRIVDNVIDGPCGEADSIDVTNRRVKDLFRQPDSGDFRIRDRALAGYGCQNEMILH